MPAPKDPADARTSTRLRVPNPPRVWVGRDRELEWLVAQLASPGVIAVCGWAGVGKSALVARALHDTCGGASLDALRVRLDGCESAADVRRRIGEALLGRSVDDLADDALLFAADRDARVVVLEDAGESVTSTLTESLELWNDFAASSRWIVLSRATLGAALPGRVLWLEPPPAADLERLADELDPLAPAEARRDAAKHARTARDVVERLGDARRSAGRAHPALEGLSSAALGSLTVLAATPRSIASDAIDREALAALVARRLVAIDGDAAHLRLDARELGLGAPGRESASVLVDALESGSPLDAAWIAIVAGDASRGAAILARTDLDALGFHDTDELWSFLQTRRDPELASAKVRAASARGDVAALDRLSAPRPDALAERRAWIRLLVRGGRFAEAEAAARESLAAIAEVDGRAELSIALAYVLQCRSRPSEAVQILEQTVAEDERVAVLRDVVLADACSMAGAHERARTLARANASKKLDARAWRTTALTLARSGDLIGAERVLDEHAPDVLAQAWSIAGGDVLLLLRLQIAVERGHARLARTLDEHAESFFRKGDVFDATLEITRSRLAILDGRLERGKERLATLGAYLADRPGTANARSCFEATREWWAIATATALEPSSSAPDAGDRSFWTEITRALAVVRSARRGAVDLSSLDPDRTEHAAVRATSRIALATCAATAGELVRAIALATHAETEARAAGYDGIAAEALLLAIEVALVAGDDHSLSAFVTALGGLADSTGAARYRREAVFFRAVAERAAGAALAREPGFELSAAVRRAAALDGAQSNLDAIDRRVVDAIRARLGSELAQTVGAPDLEEGERWTLDAEARTVFLPDGRVVDLGAQPISRAILLALARAGGSATAAEVAKQAWQLAEYHPVRDGNRLRVAMRRLRERIGAERIATTDDGYRLIGAVRLLGG